MVNLEIETKLITLSGLYGFGIYMTEPGMKNNATIRNRGRIVTDRNNNPLMFRNANIAYLFAEVGLGLKRSDYKLKVIKYDNKKNRITDICKFEAMQLFTDNTYQVITKNMIYYIKEQKIDMVRSIRYFVFEGGDINRTEQKYGRRRNKEILKLITRAAVDCLYSDGILAGVKRVNPDEIEISFKNSTTKIHIMTNGLIANINKIRRAVGETPQFSRCIPFDNTLDKYTTVFSYVTKEQQEPDGFGFDENIDQDVEHVYEYIEDYILNLALNDDRLNDFKYRPIEFHGVILVQE